MEQLEIFPCDDRPILVTEIDELETLHSIHIRSLWRSTDHVITSMSRHPCHALTHLSLTGCVGVTNFGLKILVTSFPCLVWLNLSDCYHVTDEGLMILHDLPSLTHLDVSGCGTLKTGIPSLLLALPSMGSLRCSRTSISDRELEQIRQSSSCRLLGIELDFCRDIGYTGIKHIAGLTSLRHLSLRLKNVNSASISCLSNLPFLERLRVSQCFQLGDEGMADLGRITTLRDLDVSWSSVTDAGLKKLFDLVLLHRLRIEHCSVTFGGVAALACLPSLKYLHLKHCPLSHDEIFMLQNFLGSTVIVAGLDIV